MPLWKRKPRVTAGFLWGKWFRPQVPEGHASLEAFEAAITAGEIERLPKTLQKLAPDGVERIYQVRKHDLEPGREGLEFLDALCDAELRWKLTQEQDPAFPRNLFRLVCTEFGCIVGEIHVRQGKGRWVSQRAPNLWRSHIAWSGGTTYDPFRAIVEKLSDERGRNTIVEAFDSA